jgi:hypothetical protein
LAVFVAERADWVEQRPKSPFASPAQPGYVVTLQQVGSDVVASGRLPMITMNGPPVSISVTFARRSPNRQAGAGPEIDKDIFGGDLAWAVVSGGKILEFGLDNGLKI